MENFLINIDDDTGKMIVKLTDFGISRRVKSDEFCRGSSGTLTTMAPEVVEHKKFNKKSDTWSLGIVLFELLTGTLPFNNINKETYRR